MTDNLTEELARLNASRRKVGAGDGNTYVVRSNSPDAIALANKLHAYRHTDSFGRLS